MPNIELTAHAVRALKALPRAVRQSIATGLREASEGLRPVSRIEGTRFELLYLGDRKVIFRREGASLLVIDVVAIDEQLRRGERIRASISLLRARFEPGALRTFLLAEFGSEAADAVPGPAAAPRTVFEEAAFALDRLGCLDDSLEGRIDRWHSPARRTDAGVPVPVAGYRLVYGRMEGGLVRLLDPPETGPILVFIPIESVLPGPPATRPHKP